MIPVGGTERQFNMYNASFLESGPYLSQTMGDFLENAVSPSGEIGRHSGLKIRRLLVRGRTGSIPVSGTIHLFHPLSYRLKTRMFASIAGFLLCQAVAPNNGEARRNALTFDGIRRRP